MKTLRLLCLFIGILSCSILLMISCQKDIGSNAPGGQQRVKIYLTDDPVPYNAVYVDIQHVIVQVIPDSCMGRDRDDDDDHDGDHHDWDDDHDDWCDDNEHHCSVWDTLNIRAGVYNLLNLSNGVDTLLASGTTVSGRINRIKLILGNNNSVVIDSVSYPLGLWNNNHTVNIEVKGSDIDQLTPADLQLWLDFDAGASIVRASDNHFVLKPSIKIFVPSLTAIIKGKVLPIRAKAIVAAIANNDTLVAIPDDDDGRFKIRGLKGASAILFVNATANGFRDTTITNIPLTRGRETDVGTIQLRQ